MMRGPKKNTKNNAVAAAPPAPGGNGGPTLDERPYAILERIGFALYGDLWHGKIAADIGECDRAVRRWRAGQGEPSPAALHRARWVAERHIARVQRALDRA